MTSSMNRRAFLALASTGILTLAGCGGNSTSNDTTEAADTAESTEDAGTVTSAEASAGLEPGTTENGVLVAPYDNGFDKGTHHATIEVADYGTIKVELDADTAPITVSNFAELVGAKFYDGLTFHRIIKGFMVQGGDPAGNGTGGSDTMIKGEFASNGITNGILHERGVISMARSPIPDSASSQFFIMHADAPHLDGEYAAFGHVTEGIEVVDKLVEVPVIDKNGTVEPANQPVITSIVMDD